MNATGFHDGGFRIGSTYRVRVTTSARFPRMLEWDYGRWEVFEPSDRTTARILAGPEFKPINEIGWWWLHHALTQHVPQAVARRGALAWLSIMQQVDSEALDVLFEYCSEAPERINGPGAFPEPPAIPAPGAAGRTSQIASIHRLKARDLPGGAVPELLVGGDRTAVRPHAG